jgi:hypothetical protein
MSNEPPRPEAAKASRSGGQILLIRFDSRDTHVDNAYSII